LLEVKKKTTYPREEERERTLLRRRRERIESHKVKSIRRRARPPERESRALRVSQPQKTPHGGKGLLLWSEKKVRRKLISAARRERKEQRNASEQLLVVAGETYITCASKKEGDFFLEKRGENEASKNRLGGCQEKRGKEECTVKEAAAEKKAPYRIVRIIKKEVRKGT